MPNFNLRLLEDSSSGVSKEGFISKLFPNPWEALAVFLAFIVLLVVVFFVAYKPVKKLIKQRVDYVEGKIKNAEDKEREAISKVYDANQAVKKSRQEALAIVEQAKADANKEKKVIKEQAKFEADQEVLRAKEEIAQEIEKSKDEIHSHIVDVALDASKKVLSRELKDADNEKLIKEFIDEVEEQK